MAHSLILGQTESGKTTLAKQFAAQFHAQGKGVAILDPMNDPGWTCDFRTADPDLFMQFFRDNTSCYLIVDESGKAMGKYDTEMEQLATVGRHFGHSCLFLSQRGAQINTTVRAQCSHLFLFNSCALDCKVLANDFNAPEIMQAVSLPRGAFFHKARFGPLERGKVF